MPFFLNYKKFPHIFGLFYAFILSHESFLFFILNLHAH